MASISARSASIFSCRAGSSMNSARSRSRVIGVFRSWEMAASIWVRSSMRRRRRSCISLKARAAARISGAPVSCSIETSPSMPSRSAAAARRVIGRMKPRITQSDSSRQTVEIGTTRMRKSISGKGRVRHSEASRESQLPSPSSIETRIGGPMTANLFRANPPCTTAPWMSSPAGALSDGGGPGGGPGGCPSPGCPSPGCPSGGSPGGGPSPKPGGKLTPTATPRVGSCSPSRRKVLRSLR